MPTILTEDEKILHNLQDDVASRLKADEYIGTLKVLTERKSDLVTEINNALAILPESGALGGACVLVTSIVGNTEYRNVPNVLLDLDVTVLVLENPLFNTAQQGTQKPALAIARRVLAVMHHYLPHGLTQCMTAKETPLVPVQNDLAPVAYECRFTCRESTSKNASKVAIPVVASAGSLPSVTLTVTCATAEAEIYYTRDGSHPWKNNNAAALYSGPLTVDEATEFRFSAFKAGMIESDCVYHSVE